MYGMCMKHSGSLISFFPETWNLLRWRTVNWSTGKWVIKYKECGGIDVSTVPAQVIVPLHGDRLQTPLQNVPLRA